MRDGERGQSSVELALVLPFVAMLALLLVQGALVARDQVLVVHAARAAVREASVGADDGRVGGAARQSLPGASVGIQRGSGVGDPVTVSIRFVSRTDVPLVGALLPDVTLTSEAVMRAER